MAFPNTQYVTGPDLQMYFVDKDTGFPLANGIVTFYEQEDQSVLKPIFQLDNSSPTGFSELPNPIFLTSVGTFSDNNGNDIIPYFFPFNDVGDEELYFVKVQSSGGVLQFTRQDWPPNFASNVNPDETNTNINYVTNGQFLLHNDNPIIQTVTNIGTNTVVYTAPGGWTFEKESTSTSTDTISYIRQISSSSDPNIDANPRYFWRLTTTGVDANYLRKDLCITFPDVNKFAGIADAVTSFYTISFQGQALSGGEPIVDIRIRKFFGSGGSASTDISKGTIEFVPGENLYNFPFQFGSNEGDTVGALDTDFIQIALRFPNSAQVIQLTDFVITPGDTIVAGFPQTPNADFIRDATIGWLPTPAHDGSDLYLPIVLTPQGTITDRSVIGEVVAEQSLANYTGSLNNISNKLLADGSQYLMAGISPLGIPYSRLGSTYTVTAAGFSFPMYGTGLNFATMGKFDANASEMGIVNNQSGSGVPASEGTAPTGFSFRPLMLETAQSNVFINRGGNTFTFCRSSDLVMADGASSTGIIFTPVRIGLTGNYNVYIIDTQLVNATIMAGTYFTFTANATSYYCWFKYNGAGSDPAPGGFGILINLYTGYDTGDICYLITYALKGGPGESITVGAGSTVPANSWWQFTAPNGNKYYVWYSLNGNGTDPSPSGFTLGIPVNYTTLMTSDEISAATSSAVNLTYFRVPNLQGLFLRGYDPSTIWDLNATNRYGIMGDNFGNIPGTFEYDQFMQPVTSPPAREGATGAITASTTFATAEVIPVNANVIWAIKY